MKPKLRRCNWPQAMHFALLNGMELFCFRRPISLFDGGPKTKHPPPSTAATMTTTTFPRSSTPTTSHLSLFFKKNSRHHHRPCLPRRRHPLRPAQRRGHRRAMRFDGENFVYPSRKAKFREEFCFPSKFFKEKSQAHFLTPEKKNVVPVGLPRLPPRLAGQPRRGHGPHAEALRDHARHERQGETFLSFEFPLSFLSFSSFSSSFSEAEKGSGGCEKRLDLHYSFLSSLSPLAD